MKKRNLKKPATTKAKYKKTEPVVEATQDDSSLTEGQEESKTLTEEERQELTGLEDAIRSSQKQFIAVGSALHAIHEKKLYKEFGDFDVYCDKKMGVQWKPRPPTDGGIQGYQNPSICHSTNW